MTYYVQAGSYDGIPLNSWDTLTVNLSAVPPPVNDNFADAMAVTSLPFSDNQDLTGATLQAGEPHSGCSAGFIKSVWYAFTPSTSGLYSASTFTSGGANVVVFTGTSLDSLTEIACGASGGLGTFHADEGTTYYLQTGTWFSSASVETRIEVTPPPAVGFGWGPSYPSTFDTLTFYPQGWDPAGIGFASWTWSFGDGTTSAAATPQHRFVKDGDYTVSLTGTTTDGRSNSNTQVVHVQTHDVSILWFSTPGKARVGQTSPLEVGIGNTRYTETVQVDFYKSTTGGFQLIGTVTKTIPVMKAKKTASVSFNYTFANDDLAVGKVTFEAVATVLGDRPAIDAFPVDNTAISQAARVTR